MAVYYLISWLPLGLWDFGAALAEDWDMVLNPHGFFSLLMDVPDMAVEQVGGAVRDIAGGAAAFAWSYVQFLPTRGETTFSETADVDTVGFECIRSGCTVEVGGIPITIPVESETVVRLFEGSAGASRYWWEALAGPIADMNAVADGARFEFSDADAIRDSSTGEWGASFRVQSDLDCDGLQDVADACPTLCYPEFGELDRDGDGLGNICDYCTLSRRTDDLPPRLSPEYDAAPATPPLPTDFDSDGDDVGNRCDLCPDMNAQSDGLTEADEESIIPELMGLTDGRLDEDRDGVGDRCDNCKWDPNRDQANCNAIDEVDWDDLTEPPTVGAVGRGDVCDPYPCVDSCTNSYAAPDHEPDIELPLDPMRTHGEATQPAGVDVCPVACDPDYCELEPADRPATRVELPEELDTTVRGCNCTKEEGLAGLCGTVHCPVGGITDGTRWEDASYPGVLRDHTGGNCPRATSTSAVPLGAVCGLHGCTLHVERLRHVLLHILRAHASGAELDRRHLRHGR